MGLMQTLFGTSDPDFLQEIRRDSRAHSIKHREEFEQEAFRKAQHRRMIDMQLETRKNGALTRLVKFATAYLKANPDGESIDNIFILAQRYIVRTITWNEELSSNVREPVASAVKTLMMEAFHEANATYMLNLKLGVCFGETDLGEFSVRQRIAKIATELLAEFLLRHRSR